MQNMSSGNHCILYKRPHPDFFRKMFTLCFCFNQNVSPLISPWFRHFLFPVPPSFSCQWSVLGPRCSRRHCVRPGQGGPLSPRPHRTPGTPGWSATRHVTPPPSCELPLPLDRPSSIPRGSLAARDTLPRSRPSGFLPSCTSIHRQLFAMNHVLQANVSSTLEIFIRILILHLASFHVKNRNKMLNYNSSWNYYTTDLLTSFQSELQLAHFRTRNSLAVSVIAMLAS